MALFRTKNDPVRVKLVCDPSSDDEKTVFLVTPLSHLDLKQARMDAGAVPFAEQKAREARSRKLLKAVGEAIGTSAPWITAKDYLAASEQLDKECASEDKEVAQKALDARRAFLDAMTDIHSDQTTEEFEAMRRLSEWELRVSENVVAKGVLEIDNEKCKILEALAMLQNPSHYETVVHELAAKVREVSELSPEGKSEYQRRFGLTSTKPRE